MRALPGLGVLIVGIVSTLAPAPGQDAPPFPAKYWKEAPDQAEVRAATYIGGKGTEWLVSGGFQGDETIVLAGNVLGPVLELPVEVKVLGADLPAPAEPKPVPQLDGKGAPRTDKQGNPLWEKPSWRHEGTTGFILRCSGDLKKIISAHRLPWTSGAITSAAVGKDGAIYIAGRATDGIARLHDKAEELEVGPGTNRKDGKCAHTFLARLKPDASAVEWVRQLKGPSDAPQLSVTDDGSVRLAAQDVRTFDPAGKLLATVVVPGGVKKTSSVSPVDGGIVTGGEHHWPTGREPWRCPTLNIHQPDGRLKYQLYDWGGPYVGLDISRLVSDTAVRFVTHDRDGSILLYAWSDGGNSVMTRQPTDVRTGVNLRGLGITAAGAGVLSCAYVVRIEPKDFRVTGWTIWLAFGATGKPNSVWIDNLAVAADGSVCVGGRSALGLWQTKNKLTDAAPEGEYVAVFDRDLNRVRFCSVVPGAGAAEVSHDRAGWGIVTGTVNGKPRALFVGGVAEHEKTPTVNAGQDKFGGGWCDGYAVLLDLSKEAPPAEGTTAAVEARPGPTAISFERGAGGSGGGKGNKAPMLPPDDTTFLFKGDVPRWVTVDAEFRDRGAKMWPSFFYGKPVEGKATFHDGKLEAAFTVATTAACQPRGDQDRRLLGELFQDGKPPEVRFTLQSLGERKKEELTRTDAKGKTETRVVEYSEGKGVLELAGKKIEVAPRVTYGFGKTQGVYRGPGKIDAPADSLKLTAWMTLKAGDLGLKAPGADAEIDIRFGMSGHAPPPAPDK